MKTLDAILNESKGVVISHEFTRNEFLDEIRKGEQGEFISIEEVEKEMDEWFKNNLLKE